MLDADSTLYNKYPDPITATVTSVLDTVPCDKFPSISPTLTLAQTSTPLQSYPFIYYLMQSMGCYR